MINNFTDLIVDVFRAINAKDQVPAEHYYLFDSVTYLLIQFGQEIELNAWTDICYELMRKSPLFRNEIVMFHYRIKLQ